MLLCWINNTFALAKLAGYWLTLSLPLREQECRCWTKVRSDEVIPVNCRSPWSERSRLQDPAMRKMMARGQRAKWGSSRRPQRCWMSSYLWNCAIHHWDAEFLHEHMVPTSFACEHIWFTCDILGLYTRCNSFPTYWNSSVQISPCPSPKSSSWDR